MITVKKTAAGYEASIDGKNVKLIANEDHYAELPANSLNRKWLSLAKVDKAEKQTLVITEKATAKKFGPRAERPAVKMSEQDQTAVDKIDDQIAQLKAKRSAITAKYSAKKPTQLDLMVAALAKKYNQSEDEIRKTIAQSKKTK
jgi:hypothetical protein